MTAKDLMSEDIVPLQISDTGHSALNRMTESNVRFLPVLEEKVFKGMLSEYEVKDMPFLDESIKELPFENERLNVHEYDHFFDIIGKMNQYATPMIPVLDDEGSYVGMIKRETILQNISNIRAFTDPGGVLVLEMNATDYSMSEIANIVEQDNARIWASYIEMSPDTKKMTVTIKVSKMELDRLIASFERYDYTIKAFYKKETSEDILQERYDSLMNYLNI